MTRFLVDVQLEVLLVDKETATLLVNSKVGVVPLIEEIYVITVC